MSEILYQVIRLKRISQFGFVRYEVRPLIPENDYEIIVAGLEFKEAHKKCSELNAQCE